MGQRKGLGQACIQGAQPQPDFWGALKSKLHQTVVPTKGLGLAFLTLVLDSHWLWAAPGEGRAGGDCPPSPHISREGDPHEQTAFSREKVGGSPWQPIPEAGGRWCTGPDLVSGWGPQQ